MEQVLDFFERFGEMTFSNEGFWTFAAIAAAVILAYELLMRFAPKTVAPVSRFFDRHPLVWICIPAALLIYFVYVSLGWNLWVSVSDWQAGELEASYGFGGFGNYARMFASDNFLPALKKLETLDLSGCLVSAELMEQIGGLTALQTLNLNECGLSNISALGNLTELTSLDLSNNSISDLSALRGCQKLSVLLVASNALVDLNALSGMTTLTELDISGNRVTSLEPLAACTGMLTLRVNSNGLSAIGVLQNMPELQIFQASNNSISDVSPLNSCTQLVRLNLKNNQVTTADFLSLMPLLTHVDISHNSISALPQLPENAALQKLYASYNQLTDLTVLSNLASLNYVDVDYNPELTDLGCLASCYMLVQVNAFGTKVTDVSALTAMNVIVNYDPTSVSAG